VAAGKAIVTPLRFEEMYGAEWAELEALVDEAIGRRSSVPPRRGTDMATRLAALYRRACEQLALARARAYPPYIVDRLERVTATAHQLIYQQHEFGAARIRQILTTEFPRSVRHHRGYVGVAAATFLLPTLVIGVLVYWRPELILSVVSSETAAQFEEMYSPSADSIGRTRNASTDWMMFGYYIRNNIGVAFQCFAGGLFAGLGTLFFLAYNGAFSGALAGYLTERGLSATFYSFIATHSAFELTAIVLSGAAGLRLGHAVLAPGRSTRGQSLVVASRECAVLIYGVTAMLLVAAAIEAFWSSAQWLAPGLKYSVAAACWTAVLGYLVLQGRRAG
jgi:uncharacterized membrane protein SpoIIM required for sporulation